MNKKIIVFMTMVLFLSAISYSEEKALSGKDYAEIIKQKDEEIAMLKIESMEKAKLIQQKDEEIKSLKWLFRIMGIDAPPLSQEKVVLGKIKIIDKPVYGVRLGEDITELAKVRSVEFMLDRGPWKIYRVKSESPDARDLSVMTFDDKIASISVYPADISISNYNAILEGIKTEYPDLEEGPTTVDRRHDFTVLIDQEEVEICVMHKERSMESTLLIVSYVHTKLGNEAAKVEEDKKASKIDNEL